MKNIFKRLFCRCRQSPSRTNEQRCNASRISSDINNSTKSDTKDCGNSDSAANTNLPQTHIKKDDAECVPQHLANSYNAKTGEDCVKKTDDGCILRKSSYVQLTDAKYIAGISLQGRSHLSCGVECQDSHNIKDLGDGWLLAMVSDGAGSAKESARGSEANCKIIEHLLVKLLDEKGWIKNNYLPDDKEWYIEMYNILFLTQKIITDKANEQDFEPRLLNATIIVLIITPQGMLSAHIGDGRMGYKSADGKWHSLMIPHKGEEANQTVFVTNEWNMLTIPAFRMSGVNVPETRVVQEYPMAFVLMSDGCEHSMWQCSSFNEAIQKYEDLNQPYDKFLDPLLADVGAKKGEEQRIDRLMFITDAGTRTCLREQDDRTIIIGQL